MSDASCSTNQFFGSLSVVLCKRWLQVGGDAVGVGDGKLVEGLFPVGGEASFDESGSPRAPGGGRVFVFCSFWALQSSLLQIVIHKSFMTTSPDGK